MIVARDMLVELECNWRGETNIELYRVLAVFDEHYNKWCPSVQGSVGWNNWVNKKELKKKVFLRLVMRHGNGTSVEDVKLEKNGEWGPQHVYVAKGLDKLLDVKGNIRET